MNKWYRIVAVLWLTLLSGYVLAGSSQVPFHGDESTTIWMSKDYAYLVEGDLARVRYNEPPVDAAEQQLRLITGSLTKYLMGLSWQMSGNTTADINEQWHWGFDWDWNVTNGHMPSDDLLLIGRWSSALMLMMGVWVMFKIGEIAAGPVAAYSSSLLYAMHPALLLNGRRAMFEGGMILFLLLTVLLGLMFLRRQSWDAAFGLGLVAGLALSAKHSAVFTVVLVLGICLLIIVYENRQSLRDVIGGVAKLILTGGITIGVFYVLHPVLWGEGLLTRAQQVIDGRAAMLDGQVNAFGGYETISERLLGAASQIFLLEPQYFEVPGWGAYIGQAIINYESTYLAGLTSGALLWGILMCVLGVLGVWNLSFRPVSNTLYSQRLLLIGWAVGMVLTTALITPIEWQRYYLMAILPLVMTVGVGLSAVIRFGLRMRGPVSTR